MNIIVLHNTYTKHGGEDSVVNNEMCLLKKNGMNVLKVEFSNDSFQKYNTAQTIQKSFFNKGAFNKLIETIGTFKPDIIHVHNFFYESSPSIFYAARKLNIPIVVTIHNFRLICAGSLLLRDNKICEVCTNKVFPIDGIKNKCFQNSYLKTAQLTAITGIHKLLGTWTNKIDSYISLTAFTKDKLVNSSLQLDANKVFVKPNFVEDLGSGIFEEREDFFLFIGRLSQEKGIDILLEAAIQSNQKLFIVGDGPLVDKVMTVTLTNKNIEYKGVRSKIEVIGYLKKCKALIFSSICYEGMPMTVLEAFSTGTPVIASDIDNINQIVLNNYNGIHFKTGDSSVLAHKMKSFSVDDNKCLYANARMSYENNYHPNGNYELLIKIYEKIIKNKNNEFVRN